MGVDWQVATGQGGHAVPMARITVSLLDPFALTANGQPIPLKNRKAQALLGYLLLSSTQRESRERLSGLLWSESSEEKARGSLRQTLHQLREIFQEVGSDCLVLGREDVRLEKSFFDVDAWAVQDRLADRQMHPLLLDRKRLSDSLLQGFEDVDPSFRGWLLVQRQAFHERLERHLEAALLAVQKPAAIKPVATALLNLDPTHEGACRRLMQACVEANDVAGALRAYKNLWDLLDTEYDAEPSPATQDLVVEIKTRFLGENGGSQAPLAPSVAAVAPPARPEIHSDAAQPGADLPKKFVMSIDAFDCSAVGAAKIHVVQGFRRELIACLVRFREWYIRDGSQAQAALPTREALAEYHIEAHALQVGDAIRLILTLREAGSAIYVWSDRYQITLENWFEAQQAIVRRIAIALNVQLSAERLARVARERDGALQVYDRWLRGQALIQKYSHSDWHRAADIFREIIAEVPSFAPAYSSLVQLNNSVHLVHPGVRRSRTREAETLELARTAVQLDPVDSRAQLCLAWALLMAKQYGLAEINLASAHDLNENDPWTLTSAAHGFAFCGSFERAQALATEALRLSLAPSRTHWGYQVGIRFLCGDYAGCVDAADRARDVIPNLPGWKAAALFHLGAREEAAAEARRFIELTQSNWFGQEPATDEAVARWFLHLFPIKRHEDWERLRDGLAGAGVKVGSAGHHDW